MTPEVVSAISRSTNAEYLLEKSWRDVTWIAFDTETTGKYPIESEICEIAAVKWKNGQEIETFQSLMKPSKLMSEEVIRIHGISNEMVSTAPSALPVLKHFAEFAEGCVLLAHHAQFDLGFVAAQMDQLEITLPPELTICTSLLAQAIVADTPNHRLQTLVAHYGLNPGQAHRALDDARACLNVALKIFERFSDSETVASLASRMLRRGSQDLGPMRFGRFSIAELTRQLPMIQNFVLAARAGRAVELIYRGGSRPGQAREVQPIGVIRQLDGDALVAAERAEPQQVKRYWVKDVMSIV